MEMMINDLSLHGQYFDIAAFRNAMNLIMRMRRLAEGHGRTLYCHRNLAHAQVTRDQSMQQAMGYFGKDERRAITLWLTRHGPFWEDARSHDPDDYLEAAHPTLAAPLVTDSAVGEAAIRSIRGAEHHLISFQDSCWAYSPIPVTWRHGDGSDDRIDITNHWTEHSLELALRDAPRPVGSWGELAGVCPARFPRLTFSADCFTPLEDQPFVHSAAERILVLLDVLNRLKGCFDEHGRRTAEGHRIYLDHFAGKGGDKKEPERTWFTDSSDPEKGQFESDLTFPHPEQVGDTIQCPWHGKINSPKLRIHFSWPMRADKAHYVVYVGPKITKR